MPVASEPKTLVVKRYARARLYDAANARYVKAEQLKRWIAEGLAVRVFDAENGEDVTRVALA